MVEGCMPIVFDGEIKMQTNGSSVEACDVFVGLHKQ